MNKRYILVSLILSAISFISCSSYASYTITVDCGTSDSQLNKVLRSEIQLYFDQIFENHIVFSSKDNPNIILGTAQSNPSINDLLNNGQLQLPKTNNSDQGYHIRTIDNAIYIAAASDMGVLYGLYTLLEQYGAYFQINDERLPAKTNFEFKDLDIKASPTFKYRGLLPWDNFACGMSGFSLPDYKLLIDRSVRMKFNMLQFHFYPAYAFFTERWNGQKVLPSCIGQPVDYFKTEGSIGQQAFGDTKIFGCQEYIAHIGDPAKQADAVQEMMRKVIDYAHTKGVNVVVGFELMAPHGSNEFTYTDKPSDGNGGLDFINPLDEKNVDLSLQRYRTLVETYPNADYYWLWQSEGRGFLSRNVGREPGAKEFREKYSHWTNKPPFGDSEISFAGDIDYAYMFKQVAERLTPQERTKLATGGWSIEHIFPNIDSDIPEEVIFASLNSYNPPAAIEQQIDSYRVAENDHRAWMIEWWEFDGDQWFPQFRVNWQQQMYDKCRDFGVESVTLLGWKLTGIEHNVRYLCEYSWNPKLRGRDFYAQYIEKTFGCKSPKLEQIFNDYDKYEPNSPPATAGDHRSMLLGAGWTPLVVPQLPGTQELLTEDSWQTIVKNTVDTIKRQYENLDRDTAAIDAISNAMHNFDQQGKLNAQTLKNRLEFRVLYLKAMLAYNQGILIYDRAGTFDSIATARDTAARSFKQSLDYARQSIEKYAEIVNNKTDLGVIAQLNDQFYKVIQLNYQQLVNNNTFAVIDWQTFETRPDIKYDFSKPDAWKYRDGKIQLTATAQRGRDILSLTLGDKDTKFNSVTIHPGQLDLEKAPFMDFMVKTNSSRPIAFLFQIEGSDQYYALNLIGTQSLFTSVDSLSKEINDSQWHRVTWNLLKMFREKISSQDKPVIRNLIFGTWEHSDSSAAVDFKEFSIGIQNTLD